MRNWAQIWDLLLRFALAQVWHGAQHCNRRGLPRPTQLQAGVTQALLSHCKMPLEHRPFASRLGMSRLFRAHAEQIPLCLQRLSRWTSI